MREKDRIAVLNRRTFIASASAAACFAPFIADARDTATLERSKQFEDAFAKLLNGATPVEGKVALELPESAENGNFVSVTILVDSPMTEHDHVKAIHLLSTANPVAHVATFRLTLMNAIARVQSRMRLAKTQDVIALAELSDGTLAIATTRVKVGIGGCTG